MKSFTENWIFIGIGVVSLIIVGLAVFSISGSQPPKEVSNSDLVKNNSQVLGSEDAKVTIVEFSDFQCPACGAAHPVVKQVIKEYGDRILFAYRHFPLLATHQYALKAAEAAEAAGEQGKFWEYQDILFANQDNLKTEDLKNYAKQVGLDMKKFNGALDSGKHKDKILSDLDDGEKFGVTSTPTFFINGQMNRGALNLDQFKSAIDKALGS